MQILNLQCMDKDERKIKSYTTKILQAFILSTTTRSKIQELSLHHLKSKKDLSNEKKLQILFAAANQIAKKGTQADLRRFQQVVGKVCYDEILQLINLQIRQIRSQNKIITEQVNELQERPIDIIDADVRLAQCNIQLRQYNERLEAAYNALQQQNHALRQQNHALREAARPFVRDENIRIENVRLVAQNNQLQQAHNALAHRKDVIIFWLVTIGSVRLSYSFLRSFLRSYFGR